MEAQWNRPSVKEVEMEIGTTFPMILEACRLSDECGGWN